MKTLILVRHAAAGASRDGSDERRPLSAEGVRQARETGRRLAVRSVRPDRIMTSPADRTVETAAIVAEILKTDEGRVIMDDRIYEASESGHLLHVIREFDDADDVVLLVGHQPVLGELTAALCPSFSASFPRAGAAGIRLDVPGWAGTRSVCGNLLWTEFH
ncbi:MAG: histidine phosphatase family protein [bacterium]|nr:histidine phosphatase family protein [bacterium]